MKKSITLFLVATLLLAGCTELTDSGDGETLKIDINEDIAFEKINDFLTVDEGESFGITMMYEMDSSMLADSGLMDPEEDSDAVITMEMTEAWSPAGYHTSSITGLGSEGVAYKMVETITHIDTTMYVTIGYDVTGTLPSDATDEDKMQFAMISQQGLESYSMTTSNTHTEVIASMAEDTQNNGDGIDMMEMLEVFTFTECMGVFTPSTETVDGLQIFDVTMVDMEDSMTPNMALCLFDTDDSDSISFEEFTASDDTDESDVDEMRTVFDNADADADGELDSVELVTFIEAVDSHDDEDDHMNGDEDEHMNDGDGSGEMPDMSVAFNNAGEIEYFGMSMDGTDMQMYVLTEDKVSAFFTGAEAGELVALPFLIGSESDMDNGGTFYCDNGNDIPMDYVNDGDNDCGDNSDENVDMSDDDRPDDHGDDNHGDDSHDDDTLMNEYRYKCFNFVEFSLLNGDHFTAFNMTFNTTSVDSTMCGELVSENSQTRDWDTGEFTMPESLTYLDCEDDPQEGFNCVMGMITGDGDENASNLYDTHYENTSESECSMSHPMSVYDNDTNMCKEFIGEIMNFDSMAFEIISNGEVQLVYYQYDASTGSGLLMVVENINSDDDYDSHEEMMWTFNREMSECDSDADGMVNFSELDECVSNDIANDGYGDQGLDELQQMFDMVDADEDGMLDSDEFSVFAAMTSGEPMMVCYDMNSHEIDMSITSEADCDAAGLMWTEEENGGNHDGNDNHDDNGDSDDIMFYITTGDVMVPFEGDMNDYSIVLASCEQSTSMETGELIKDCSTYMTVSMNDAMLDGSSVMFHDTDSSGTISDGDMIHVSVSESGNDWNEVRLYSTSADAYSDENPMHNAPGFTGLVGMLALLGAAFIRRND